MTIGQEWQEYKPRFIFIIKFLSPIVAYPFCNKILPVEPYPLIRLETLRLIPMKWLVLTCSL